MNDAAAITITRMAQRGTLQVEHLLRTVHRPSLELADGLDALVQAMDWPLDPTFPEVPWATWILAVGIFCRRGYSGLFDLAEEPDMLSFAVAVLGELKTPEALATLVSFAGVHQTSLLSKPAQLHRVISGLNVLGMRQGVQAVTEADRIGIRDFLHTALSFAQSDHERGGALGALRYFGDETSLRFISKCPALAEHWEPARRAAIRGIKKAGRERMDGPSSAL